MTLAGASTAGSGHSFYIVGDVAVVLREYQWHTPATPPGDVCQPMTFTSGGGADFFGSFTLQVFPTASLTLSQSSGAPLNGVTFTGSGFAPGEAVSIFAGHIGAPPLFAAATADSNGSFSVSGRVPQHPLGPMDVYALGAASHKLGPAGFSVTSDLLANPGTAAPGGSTTVSALGFGAGETVNIYWNEPRQLLGSATANTLGTATLPITVPSNASPGVNGIIGIGQTTNAIGLGGIRIN